MRQLRDYIEKHPESAKKMVGLDYSQLIELISHAERLHNQQKKAAENNKIRIIKAGGVRLTKLSLIDQIILPLVYLHNLPIFQMEFNLASVNQPPITSFITGWVF